MEGSRSLGVELSSLPSSEEREQVVTKTLLHEIRGARRCKRNVGPEGGMHMRHYEAVIIYDLGFEPQAIQAHLDKALEIITSNGGSIDQIDRWGRRPFVYEVKHKREGYYVIVHARTENDGLNAVDRMLRLSDEVLRHKLIRIPDKIAAQRAAVA